jgi:hypothetical protein
MQKKKKKKKKNPPKFRAFVMKIKLTQRAIGNLGNLECKNYGPDSHKKSKFLPVNILKHRDLGKGCRSKSIVLKIINQMEVITVFSYLCSLRVLAFCTSAVAWVFMFRSGFASFTAST